MQAVTIILWTLITLFIYFLGMGITKAIGLKAWGKPDTSLFSSRLWCQGRTNFPAVTFAQIFWPITLTIWGLIGMWWVGQHSPRLTMDLLRWIDKSLEEDSERAKLRATQTQQHSLPPKQKTQWRKKKQLRSGTELEIYEQKDKK